MCNFNDTIKGAGTIMFDNTNTFPVDWSDTTVYGKLPWSHEGG